MVKSWAKHKYDLYFVIFDDLGHLHSISLLSPYQDKLLFDFKAFLSKFD